MRFDIVVRDMDGITQETVDGRQLHEALGIETPFHKWIKRQITACSLVEHFDYEVVDKKVRNSKGGKQRTTEYALSVDAAKHVA